MLKTSGIPVIFFQLGRKTTVDIALRQASLAAKDSDVILLTDEVRSLPVAIHQVRIDEYLGAANRFRAVYVHTSVNGAFFEIICFLRWFIIRDFVRRHGLERFCVFDSDIMLFSPVKSFADAFGSHLAGNWAWANCFANAAALDPVCDYFHRVYANPPLRADAAEKHGRSLGVPHLSDMHLWADLADQDARFLDQKDFPAAGYDRNVRSDDNGMFIMNGAIKHLTIDTQGVPVARQTDGALVPFHFLHFQGPAKSLMEEVAWRKPGEQKARVLQAPGNISAL